jgi:hypothetical protein
MRLPLSEVAARVRDAAAAAGAGQGQLADFCRH